MSVSVLMARKVYTNKSFLIKWATLIITLSFLGHFLLFKIPNDVGIFGSGGGDTSDGGSLVDLSDHEIRALVDANGAEARREFDSVRAKLPVDQDDSAASRKHFVHPKVLTGREYEFGNGGKNDKPLPPRPSNFDKNELPVPPHRRKLAEKIRESQGAPAFDLDVIKPSNLNFSELFTNIPDNTVKIDWHNYKLMEADKLRTGPGEQGTAFVLDLSKPGYNSNKSALFSVNGFNAFASDFISLNRSLRDIRHPACKTKTYLSKLPTVSIVIPFHQEHWTTLLRSVHSVINRSPPEVLKEIILVDDFSTKEFLKQPLDDYLKNVIPAQFGARVVRTKAREGLIRARILGAKNATADVIVFLDSHIEANVNWLPPLLEPIAQNRQTVVCPFIDVIDFDNFEYRAQDEGARGAFDWELFYKRLPLLPEDLKHPSEPFKSPVMAGGLFAIDREYFNWLGMYDDGLQIWGGEQYELSFKIWQCGGIMVDAPCSRVGHIYRKYAPFPNPQVGDFVGKNYRRVADVWMDEYKEYILMRRPQYRSLDPGDLTIQKGLRKKLNCKPFKWFMEEIAFDLPLKYPMIEPPDYANGEIRSVSTDLCLEIEGGKTLRVNTCAKDDPNIARDDQRFIWSWKRDIKLEKRDLCLDLAENEPGSKITIFPCHGMKGNQYWRYYPSLNRIFHQSHRLCLDYNPKDKSVSAETCYTHKKTQQWAFENFTASIINALPN